MQTTLSPTRYFLFQIISFKKYFYVSLGDNLFTVFFVEVPGQLPSLPPPPSLNPAVPTAREYGPC